MAVKAILEFLRAINLDIQSKEYGTILSVR